MPLTERAAKAIGDQQSYVAAEVAGRSVAVPRHPSPRRGPTGPSPYRFLHRRLCNWQTRIDLRDEAGLPITVSPHQFRHTLGTRLINSGVPQHVVQRILGHASPGMTDVYAQLHDSTVRIAFDRFQKQRVDIAGRVRSYDPESPAADAEWLKHNLARIPASLPNGYCGGRPSRNVPIPIPAERKARFRTSRVIDAHSAWIYRRPGPAPGHGGRPPKSGRRA